MDVLDAAARHTSVVCADREYYPWQHLLMSSPHEDHAVRRCRLQKPQERPAGGAFVGFKHLGRRHMPSTVGAHFGRETILTLRTAVSRSTLTADRELFPGWERSSILKLATNMRIHELAWRHIVGYDKKTVLEFRDAHHAGALFLSSKKGALLDDSASTSPSSLNTIKTIICIH